MSKSQQISAPREVAQTRTAERQKGGATMATTKNKVTVFVAITLVAILVFGLVACSKSEKSGDAPDGAAPDASTINVDLDAIQVDELLGEFSTAFLDSSMTWKSQERVGFYSISDAVSFPFTKVSGKKANEIQGWYESLTDKEKQEFLESVFTEICEEIARNPVYGDMWARALLGNETARALLSHTTVAWLEEFVAKTDAARESSDGWEYWLRAEWDANGPFTHHEAGSPNDGKKYQLHVTDEYRKYASGIIAVIDYMVKKGVASPYANSWYLKMDAQASMVRTQYSRAEERVALVLEYIDKDGNVLLTTYVNLLDKRVEFPGDKPKPDRPGTPGTSENPPSSEEDPPSKKNPGKGTQAEDKQDQGEYDNNPSESAKPPVDKPVVADYTKSWTEYSAWTTTGTFTEQHGSENVTFANQSRTVTVVTAVYDGATNREKSRSSKASTDTRTIEVSRNAIESGGDGGGFEPPPGR